MTCLFDFTTNKANGSVVQLSEFRNKVVLVVNVASGCGLTPQYEKLQALYEKYLPRGFVILGFPCNQFGNQESGSNAEIQNFCSTEYAVKFPVFSKIEVNGSNADPIFIFLKEAAPGLLGSRSIKWNFTKFLVSKDGQPLKRYAPTTKPEKIIRDIENELRKK